MITRRRFLGFLSGALGALIFGYGFFEKDKFKIERINFKTKKWKGEKIKIVFLSDLHRGPFTTHSFLKEISKKVSELNPDILIFGGDYIYASKNYIKSALEPFKILKPKLGKWGVLGNHDNFLGRKEVIKTLEENEIFLLNNESIKLLFNEGNFYLFGVDDFKTGKADLRKALKYLKDDSFAIGISHNPVFWKFEKIEKKVDLLLSGHTHGGQIDLPFLGPVFLLPGHGREFYRGFYKINGIKLYVSRGIGTIHLPLRLFCPPEITLIDIHPEF